MPATAPAAATTETTTPPVLPDFTLLKTNTLGALPPWTEPPSLDNAAATITQLGRNIHEHAYLIGKTLTWVKAAVGHGNFQPWVRENVWFSQSTAKNFMAFAGACDDAATQLEYHTPKTPAAGVLPPQGDPAPIIPEVLDDDEAPDAPDDEDDSPDTEEPGPVVRKGLTYAGRRRALRHCQGLRKVLDQEIGLWNVDLIRRDVDTLLGMLEATNQR